MDQDQQGGGPTCCTTCSTNNVWGPIPGNTPGRSHSPEQERNPRTGYLQPINQEPYSVLARSKVGGGPLCSHNRACNGTCCKADLV